VIKSLDPMWLDPEAMKAIQEWRFTPGTRMGEPVPVMVNIEFSFAVRPHAEKQPGRISWHPRLAG
jgi:outer membrane biosynthesis protein TonB